MKYDLHRFCEAFRRAKSHEKAEIVANMKTYGYDKEQPIMLYEDLILDGATRQDAAEDAGVKPTFTTFNGSDDDAIAFVIRRNKARKHMTQGELDLAGARLVTAKKGGQARNVNAAKTKGSPETHSSTKTRAMVGKELGRSPHTIKKAREVLAKAAPNIIAMVEAGEIAVSVATDGIRGKTKAEQQQMTAADVRKAANLYKNKKSGNKPPKITSPKTDHSVAPRYTNLTKVDLGDDDSSIHGQPVQLQPVRVQRLTEAMIRLKGVEGRVQGCAAMDIDQFADDVEKLTAYVPALGKTNGEQRDYAKEAKKSLREIDQYVEKAITRLTALRDVLVKRKQAA